MIHKPHPFDWKIIQSQYLIQNRWLNLRADRCQMPSGLIIDPYYVIESPDFINVVPITDDNQVVLVREYRHGLGQTVLELVGGVVESSDETPVTAARRELLEETGYGAGEFIPLCVLSPNPGRFNNLSHSFLARGVKQIAEISPDHTEEIEVVLVPFEQVMEMLRANTFVQAMHSAALFYAWQYFQQNK